VKKDVKMPVQGSLCSVALFAVVLLCACTILSTIVTTLNNRSYVSINGWKACLVCQDLVLHSSLAFIRCDNPSELSIFIDLPDCLAVNALN